MTQNKINMNRGKKIGTKNSTPSGSQYLIFLFTDSEEVEYCGVFINQTHAADYIQNKTGISTRSSSIQKYVAEKINTLQGYVAVMVNIKHNPLDGIPKEIIETARQEAIYRRRRVRLSKLTNYEIKNLTNEQINRINAILHENIRENE